MNGTTHIKAVAASAPFPSLETLTITFSAPILAFAADFFDISDTSTVQFTAAGETLDLPIFPDNTNSFYGLVSDTAFTSITIGNVFNADTFGVDDVTYEFAAPVPLPATVLMLIAGLGGVASLRLQRG